MQTLKELLAEIEDLRSQVAAQDRKPRVPGKVPAVALPKAAGAAQSAQPAAALPPPDKPASAGQPIADAPQKQGESSPAAQTGDTAPDAPPAKPADTTPGKPSTDAPARPASASAPGKLSAKVRIESATKEKARSRLKEIMATAKWYGARYAAASALEEKIDDIEFDTWLVGLKRQVTTPATLDEGMEDARELVRAIRNKSVWKEEKAVPEERKTHVRKAEQLLVELMDGGDEVRARKTAEMLYENGTRSEIRMAAGKKLGHSEADILFREWTVRGKKLEKPQLETIYNNAGDWRRKWQAGKELGIKQAAVDVYEKKDADRVDRLEASRLLGVSAADFALHERSLGKELTKDDLKQIWIGAKDEATRNAAAKDLGHSPMKIWMAEHPAVVVAAGIVLLVAVGAVLFLKPWHRPKRARATDIASERAKPERKAAAKEDTPSPTNMPSEPGTEATPEDVKAGTNKGPISQPPDYSAEKIDMADVLSGGKAIPSAGHDLTAVPPALPEESIAQLENLTNSTGEPSSTISNEPAIAQPASSLTAEPPSAAETASPAESNTVPANAGPPLLTAAAVAVTSGPVEKATVPVAPPVLSVVAPPVVATATASVAVSGTVPATEGPPPVTAAAVAVSSGPVEKAAAPVAAATSAAGSAGPTSPTSLVSNQPPPRAVVSENVPASPAVASAVAKVSEPKVAAASSNDPVPAAASISNKVPSWTFYLKAGNTNRAATNKAAAKAGRTANK